MFSFTKKELNYLESRYRERRETLKELLPWDDPNYGIDEQWAVCYPYGLSIKAGATTKLEVRLTNHSNVERTFRVTPRGHGGIQVLKHDESITLAPRASGSIEVRIKAPNKAGNTLVTADVSSNGMHFREWTEALVTIE